MPKINKSLNRLREKGYNVKNVLSIIENDNETNTVVYTAPEFQPCAETFSDKYHFVGASIRPFTEEYSKSDVPTVYISLGTVVNRRADFYKNCITALKDCPCRVIMSVGEITDIASLGRISENMRILPSVDQPAVLSAADAFITHCGMNSVNEALYFGVPMVLFPQTPEQFCVASRTCEVGAGIMPSDSSPQTIKEALTEILQNGEYKASAKKMSDAFRRLKGAQAAADVIEKAAK